MFKYIKLIRFKIRIVYAVNIFISPFLKQTIFIILTSISVFYILNLQRAPGSLVYDIHKDIKKNVCLLVSEHTPLPGWLANPY